MSRIIQAVLLHSFDPGSDGLQLLFNLLVAAIQVIDAIHDRSAFRNERRKMEAMSRRMHHAEDQCITEIIQSAPARQADVITIEVTSTSVSTAEFLKETRHDRIPEPRTN